MYNQKKPYLGLENGRRYWRDDCMCDNVKQRINLFAGLGGWAGSEWRAVLGGFDCICTSCRKLSAF